MSMLILIVIILLKYCDQIIIRLQLILLTIVWII